MSQRGFTLLEMLMVLAIGGFIVTLLGSTISGMLRGTARSSGSSVALTDLDRAFHFLSQDVVLGQTTSLTDGAPPVDQMTLTWSDLTGWAATEGVVTHSVIYCHNKTSDVPPCDAGTTNELKRDLDGQVSTVGRYMTLVQFSRSGKNVTVRLTSSDPGYTPVSSYTVSHTLYMRAAP